MNIILDFDEMGITAEFGESDIINRACDMVMELCFPEFEESDVLDNGLICVDMQEQIVDISIKLKINSEF